MPLEGLLLLRPILPELDTETVQDTKTFLSLVVTRSTGLPSTNTGISRTNSVVTIVGTAKGHGMYLISKEHKQQQRESLEITCSISFNTSY